MADLTANPRRPNHDPRISCCVNNGDVMLKEGSVVPKEEAAALQLAPAAAQPSDSTQAPTGEEACEGQDLDEQACRSVGCCEWHSGKCHSAVWNEPCIKVEEQLPSCAVGAEVVVQPSRWGKCYCGMDDGGIDIMGQCNNDPNHQLGWIQGACSGSWNSTNRFDDPSGMCGFYCMCGQAMADLTANPRRPNHDPRISCCVNNGDVMLKEGSLVPKEEAAALELAPAAAHPSDSQAP